MPPDKVCFGASILNMCWLGKDCGKFYLKNILIAQIHDVEGSMFTAFGLRGLSYIKVHVSQYVGLYRI